MTRRTVLFATLLATSCVAPAPVRPLPSVMAPTAVMAPPPATPPAPPEEAPVPVEVVDEVMRVSSRGMNYPELATDPAGGAFIAQPTGTFGADVTSLDAQLATRWRVHLAGRVDTILALPGGRCVAFNVPPTMTFDGAPSLTLFSSDGKQESVTFEKLVGERCELFSSGATLQATTFTVDVACGPTRQRKRLALSQDLRTFSDVGLDAAPWSVDRTPTGIALKRGAQTQLLVRAAHPLEPSIHREFMSLAPPVLLAPDDGLVAGGLIEPAGEARGPFNVFGVVMRTGGRTTWTSELLPHHLGQDPERFTSVTAGREGEPVYVLVEYGETGALRRTPLPAPASAVASTWAHQGQRGLVVAALDAQTGALRSATVLRPKVPWGAPINSTVSVTPDHFIVNSMGELFFFPRHGPAVPASPAVDEPAVPEVSPLAPVNAERVRTLSETWSQPCAFSKSKTPCRLEHVALGADGTVAAFVGEQPGATGTFTGLAVFDARGQLRWKKAFDGLVDRDQEELLIRADGRVVMLARRRSAKFAIDGVRLPERRPVAPLHDARSQFLAVFDPAGKLELLEDLDAFVLGNRAPSLERGCSAVGSLTTTPNEVSLMASCPDALLRTVLLGTKRGAVEPLTSPPVWSRWYAADAEHAVGLQVAPFVTRLFGMVKGRAVVQPLLVASQPLFMGMATSAQGTWVAQKVQAFDLQTAQLFVAHVDPTFERTVVRSFTPAAAFGPAVDALAIDDEGRALLALQRTEELEVGGQRFAKSRGHVFVRLTADAAQVDAVWLAELGSCAEALVNVESMSARGRTLALTVRTHDTSCPAAGRVAVFPMPP